MRDGEYPPNHFWSSEWTGRFPRCRMMRRSTAVWAKAYVWLRYEVKDRLCRLFGGHDFGWRPRCESCGITWEEQVDHSRSLREALRCWAVVL